MKNQALFSSKDKSKKLKCHPLQFLFDTLRAKLFAFYSFTVLSQYLTIHILFTRNTMPFCRPETKSE